MYKRVLATLDGSANAECALPYAEDLAKKYGAEVTLLSVAEPLTVKDDELYIAAAERQLEAAQQILSTNLRGYLSQKEKELKDKGLEVRSVLLSGKAADQIVDYASKEGFDLVIMATHGRSGIAKWAYGSVADKVLRGATNHTMLVRCPVPGDKV